MSRIYEALLRAEAEAKQSAGPGHGSAAPQANTAVLEGPAEAPSRTFPLAPAMLPSQNASANSIGFSQFAARRWNPSVQALPALLTHGPALEQFRSLRSRLVEYRNHHALKTLLVSSGIPKEGKSFIAANLAVSLARQNDTKVLLIDGDMRRCTLHQVLGCQATPGLPDYLAGNAALSDVVQRAKVTDLDEFAQRVLENLAFLPGGNSGDQAADLSGNPRFSELVSALSSAFDWIVVDSSPVVPVSDAVNLARACDGVLLVAREGFTEFEVAQKTRTEFRGSRVLGFILNAARVIPGAGTYYDYSPPREN